MKKIMLIAVLCFSTPFVLASGHDLLDEEACKKTKGLNMKISPR